MLHRLRVYLEMTRFSHTVFALPFALIGALCAARGLPSPSVLAGAVVAVVGARTAAMAWNRLVDRAFDARNPRTAMRAIPAGRARPHEAAMLVALGVSTFVLACLSLNRAALRLAVPVLAITLGYSFTKRFTALSHLVLGAALGLAPLGGWIAVRGGIAGYPTALSLGVLAWVAGFDIVYACQDEEFDRREGLHSIPAHVGRRRALALALGLHAAAVGCFAVAGNEARLGRAWYGGLAVAALALVAEHRLARREGPAGIGSAWLTLNGAVGVALLVAAALAVSLGATAAEAGTADSGAPRAASWPSTMMRANGWGEGSGVRLAAALHDAPGEIREHALALEVTGWADRVRGIDPLRQAKANSTDDGRNPLFLAEALLRGVAARDPHPDAIVEESETSTEARTRLAKLAHTRERAAR